MQVHSLSRVCLVAALVLPAVVQAQQAVTPQGANLRAGPAPNYPVVARLAPGTALNVAGCTSGYQWCDVTLPDGLRGWVYAQSLAYAYQGQPVPLAQYGATIGVPLLTFAIGSYWGSHYRDRPWYNDQRYWGGRPPPRSGPPPQRYYNAPGSAPIHIGGGGGGPRHDFRDGGGHRGPGGGGWDRPSGPRNEFRPQYDRGQRAGGPPDGGGRGMDRGGGGGRGPGGGGEGRGPGGGGGRGGGGPGGGGHGGGHGGGGGGGGGGHGGGGGRGGG